MNLTTEQKMAVMDAAMKAVPPFSNLEARDRNDESAPWRTYLYEIHGEPTWDWRMWEFRIKPPTPTVHEVTRYAHLFKRKDGTYFTEYFIRKYTSEMSKGNKLIAIKEVTVPITEGEGMENVIMDDGEFKSPPVPTRTTAILEDIPPQSNPDDVPDIIWLMDNPKWDKNGGLAAVCSNPFASRARYCYMSMEKVKKEKCQYVTEALEYFRKLHKDMQTSYDLNDLIDSVIKTYTGYAPIKGSK